MLYDFSQIRQKESKSCWIGLVNLPMHFRIAPLARGSHWRWVTLEIIAVAVKKPEAGRDGA